LGVALGALEGLAQTAQLQAGHALQAALADLLQDVQHLAHVGEGVLVGGQQPPVAAGQALAAQAALQLGQGHRRPPLDPLQDQEGVGEVAVDLVAGLPLAALQFGQDAVLAAQVEEGPEPTLPGGQGAAGRAPRQGQVLMGQAVYLLGRDPGQVAAVQQPLGGLMIQAQSGQEGLEVEAVDREGGVRAAAVAAIGAIDVAEQEESFQLSLAGEAHGEVAAAAFQGAVGEHDQFAFVLQQVPEASGHEVAIGLAAAVFQAVAPLAGRGPQAEGHRVAHHHHRGQGVAGLPLVQALQHLELQVGHAALQLGQDQLVVFGQQPHAQGLGQAPGEEVLQKRDDFVGERLHLHQEVGHELARDQVEGPSGAGEADEQAQALEDVVEGAVVAGHLVGVAQVQALQEAGLAGGQDHLLEQAQTIGVAPEAVGQEGGVVLGREGAQGHVLGVYAQLLEAVRRDEAVQAREPRHLRRRGGHNGGHVLSLPEKGDCRPKVMVAPARGGVNAGDRLDIG